MNDVAVQPNIELTAHIVSAYVSKNAVPAADLPSLIASVSDALQSIATGVVRGSEQKEPQKPAVPIKKSVTPDYIISLEDGKRFKSLKRALSTRYGLTPEEYRLKWGLPYDYPMVAPNYAATRSKLAKRMGLGRKPKTKPSKSGGKGSAG